MKVLVVCQEPRVSASITDAVIGDEQVEILEVRTPERALQQLDEVGGFDVLLADADTSPTGGFSLARDVKGRAKMGRQVPPIVLLLARDQDKYLAKWSEADAFVLKPADPFDLHAVIAAVVAGDDVPDLPGVGSTSGMPEVLQAPDGPMSAPPAAAGY